MCGGEAHPRDPPRPRLRGAGGGGRHPPLQHTRLRRGAPRHRQLRRLVVLPGIFYFIYEINIYIIDIYATSNILSQPTDAVYAKLNNNPS